VNAEELQSALAQDIASEVECRVADDGRIACFLPIVYPDGDAVAVWVDARNGQFEVTDLGEGYTAVFASFTPELKAITPFAQRICQSMGLVFADGRVVGAASSDDLAASVWTVGLASARVAEAVSFYKPLRLRDA
jgi:hypothetical protein